jgi:hypothetical protein
LNFIPGSSVRNRKLTQRIADRRTENKKTGLCASPRSSAPSALKEFVPAKPALTRNHDPDAPLRRRESSCVYWSFFVIKAFMQISQRFAVACITAILLTPYLSHADDSDVDAKLRQALDQKMKELGPESGAAPKTKPKTNAPAAHPAPPAAHTAPAPVPAPVHPAPTPAIPAQTQVAPPPAHPLPPPAVNNNMTPSDAKAAKARAQEQERQRAAAEKAAKAKADAEARAAAKEKARMDAEHAAAEKAAQANAEAAARERAKEQARLQSEQAAAAKAAKAKADAEARAAAKQKARADAERAAAEKAAAKEAAKHAKATKSQPAQPIFQERPEHQTAVTPIHTAPAPVAGSKEQRLQALLQQYQADKISPEEYHSQRAKILAEP